MPLRKLAFPDGTKVMCLCYRLHGGSISKCTNVWIQVRESISYGDGLVHLDGCPIWRGRAEESPEADVCVMILK